MNILIPKTFRNESTHTRKARITKNEVVMLKKPTFIWQEITRKVFKGNSCLCQKCRLNSEIVIAVNLDSP